MPLKNNVRKALKYNKKSEETNKTALKRVITISSTFAISPKLGYAVIGYLFGRAAFGVSKNAIAKKRGTERALRLIKQSHNPEHTRRLIYALAPELKENLERERKKKIARQIKI